LCTDAGGNNERFDPTHEKRLKARQAEKKSTGNASAEQSPDQSFDLSAPVSRKKQRRKAASPEKSVGSSARGQGAFLEMHLNGESASEQT
jgi:hypothetical protein